KGGLLLGLYAVRALREVNAAGFASVTYVCNPDEEIGSPWSGPEILTRARSADACFVLEAARENGDIVSARKGVVDVRLIVHGRAAHAGVEPERGRSAALQAAHTTIALHALNGRWPGVTVNVGVIEGGTRPNVITERCELHVDVRAPTAASLEAALDAVEEVARTTVVPDTTIELERRSGFPAMEKTAATAALVSTAMAIADVIGFQVRDAATGGARAPTTCMSPRACGRTSRTHSSWCCTAAGATGSGCRGSRTSTASPTNMASSPCIRTASTPSGRTDVASRTRTIRVSTTSA